MRIPRIYQPINLRDDSEITLSPEASQHLIKVLRLREGTTVIIFNGNGESYLGALDLTNKKSAKVRLQQPIDENAESTLNIHVGLGISKGERMDYAIQKLVETGANTITPLMTEHTVVKLDAKREQTRRLHWQGIITSACEQCGRNTLPQLQAVTTAADWIANVVSECKLVFDAQGTTALKAIKPAPATVAVLIGPEGGLSETEIQLAQKHKFQLARLGPRILRTETAAVAITAALQMLWGDY